MTKKEYKKSKTISKTINGYKVKYIPIVYDCTYHDTNNKKKLCINCDNTNYYIDGYYMIINNKIGWTVDNIK